MNDYLSTTEASKYCHVSRLTVINWANKGTLPAHKTPGGHRRIAKNDLLAFMKEHGMKLQDTELSSPEIKFRWCWQYHKDEKWKNHKCRGCLVYLTNAKKCFSLRKRGGHKRIFCTSDCKECGYFKDYHEHFQWCWEFHQETGRSGHNCHECVIFLSGIKKCFVLREETDHKKIFCKSHCSECAYYKRVARTQ